MVNFLLGTLAGAFIMLAVLQLVTKKTINLAGIENKSEDPKRYWNFVAAYIVGFLCMLMLTLYI